jgi:hypothetical protein
MLEVELQGEHSSSSGKTEGMREGERNATDIAGPSYCTYIPVAQRVIYVLPTT